MKITLKAKTPKETLQALAIEFDRQLSLVKEESLRARTIRESSRYAGRISQLTTVIEFILAIQVAEEGK